MPIHTFECEFCGHLFEELIYREADEKDLKCPQCGATHPQRRLSAPARVKASTPGTYGGGTCGTGGG